MNESWLQTLNAHGAQFSGGRVESYSSISDELGALTKNTNSGNAANGTVFCDLSHEGLVVASGDDAIAFLQGQFSNDVAALTTTTAQWNSWSSPKGRMLATFLMWRSAENVYLQLPRSLQAAIQKRLSMFVLRSKVKLVDASDSLIKIGIADRDADRLQARLEASIGAVFGNITLAPMQTAELQCGPLKAGLIRLSAHRFELVMPAATADKSAAEIWHK